MDATKAWVDKAQTLGGKAVVMTVDQQAAYYERDVPRPSSDCGSSYSPGVRPEQRQCHHRSARLIGVPERRLWYNWKYAEQVKSMLKVPMVAKGILTGEDAKFCIEHGFDGIYVSNHGGRSCDYGPSTLEVLPEIVDAVQGRVPVIVR